MLRINTTSKYAEFKSDTKSDLYPLNEISYTVENESETVSFYNRFYNKIMTEQISNIQVNDVPVNRDNIQDLLSVLFAANEGGGGGTVDLSNYYTKPEVDAKIDTKVDKVEGKQLSTEDYTTEEKTKLAGLENYDDTIVKADIASNTTAIEAEVERATAAETALDAKIPTVQTGNIGTNKNYIYSIYNDTVYSVLSSVGFVGNEADVTVFQAKWGGGTTQSKLNAATVSKSGVMSSADKTKLDSLSNYDDTTVKDDIAANKTAIEAEVVRAKAAESTLNKKIPTVQIGMLGNDKNFVYSEGKTGSTKNVISEIRVGQTEFDNFIYLTYWGNSNSSKTLYLDRATTEKAGVMTADDKKNILHLLGLGNITADEEGTLQMRDDVMAQYATITGNTTIKLPYTTYLYREFHLIFTGVTGSTITFPYGVVWKEAPTEMVNGATYEFIFTYLKNKWYGGYIKYE
jgi:hypothetical protein|nr:MAG TPA: Head fiber protein [Caudoviricetes sp.]